MKHWICLFLLVGTVAAPGQPGASVEPVKINRTVPKVEPPKTRLEFSSKPTVQEISRARVFEEPLVPIGGGPGGNENAALAAALLGYAKRSGPDEFASLMDFLQQHPQSFWRAALLTGLGLDYYNTAYYSHSRALEAWGEAWALGRKATNVQGKFLADRAVCELAGLYSRLGRMTELEALLKSVEQRVFLGGATERINMAREALSMMQHQPGDLRSVPRLRKKLLSAESQPTRVWSHWMSHNAAGKFMIGPKAATHCGAMNPFNQFTVPSLFSAAPNVTDVAALMFNTPLLAIDSGPKSVPPLQFTVAPSATSRRPDTMAPAQWNVPPTVFVDPAKINELSGERMGLVAQEVEKIFPDWVQTGADGYKRVTVRGLEALVVEALRELQQKQDARLADELKRRDAENAELKRSVEELKTLVNALAEKLDGGVR